MTEFGSTGHLWNAQSHGAVMIFSLVLFMSLVSFHTIFYVHSYM